MSNNALGLEIVDQINYIFKAGLNDHELNEYASSRLDFFKVVNAKDMAFDDTSLMFRAKTAAFDGKVIIKVNGMDTYDVELWKVQLEPFDVQKLKEINDVYCDELGNVLKRELIKDTLSLGAAKLEEIITLLEGKKLGQYLRISFTEPVSFGIRHYKKENVKEVVFKTAFVKDGNIYVNTRSCHSGYSISQMIGYKNLSLVDKVELVHRDATDKKYTFEDVKKRLYKDTWEDLTEKDFHWHLEPDSMTPIRFTSIKGKFSPAILEQIKLAFENKTEYKKRVYGIQRDLSVDIQVKDGKIKAWYSSEYAGCGNGDYYLLLNPTTAVFMEND